MEVSVIIPVFEGFNRIESLYREVKKELLKLGINYECIFIDDGSEDRTFDILRSIKSKEDGSLRIIRLSKNYGQHSAIYAGIKFSRGKKVLILSDDMKENVVDIEKFMREIETGADIVIGWRVRRNISPIRRVISHIFNYFISFIAGKRLHDPGSGFICFKRDLLTKEGNHLHMILRAKRYKVKEVKMFDYSHSKSRYNLVKLFYLLCIIILNIFAKINPKFHVAEDYE